MNFSKAVATLSEAIERFSHSDLSQTRAAYFQAQGLLSAAQFFSGDPAEARNSLRRLLTMDPGWDFPSNRRSPELASMIEGVRKELQSLSPSPLALSSTPDGATLWIDGVAFGRTPSSTPPLLPGRHLLRLTKEGYLSKQEMVFVGPGSALAWTLEADPSWIAPAAASAPPALGGSLARPGPEPSHSSAPSFWRRQRATLFLGGALLGAGATTYFALRMNSAKQEAWKLPQTDTVGYARAESQARSQAFGANLSLYLSLASAALGTTLFFLDRGPQAAAPTTSFGLAPLPEGGAFASLGGQF